MSRRYVNQLAHQEAVDEVFLASGKQLRPNRSGNLYLQIELSDRSGRVTARVWNANETLYKSFNNGDHLRVEGTAQLFQGAMQIIATKLEKVDPADVDEDDFIQLPPVEVDKLVARAAEMLRGMNNPHLQNLAECFLVDEDFMARLSRAPAGVKNHHAYLGGLIEHVVSVMEAAMRISVGYPQVDRDLLLCGAFIHDIGKLKELSYTRDFKYTDEGQMLGHLVIAVGMLEAKVAEAEKLSGESFPTETMLRLKHMLVSHHGSYEHGSPKLPMTIEATMLYFLDNLDSKVNAFGQLIKDDPNVDSNWTHYFPNLGRKLFKGGQG
jgi:3'-5' exoribonuclease